jgi:para-aminobenzoate synthetase component 2
MVAYLGVFFGLFVTWLVLILVRRSREGRTLGFRLPHVVQYAGLPAFLGVVLSSGPRTRQYRATLSKEARGGFDEVTDTLISIARRDVDDPLEPLLAREAYFSYQRWASQLGAPPPVAEHRVSRIVTVEPPAPDATTLLRGEPQAPDPTTRLDGAGTPAKSPKILVVDNYDSFVYNIVQYLAELGASVEVARNDKVSADDLAKMAVDGVLISPGPGYPRDAGNCIAIIRYCYEHHIPMLGVCLGHQALGEAFGGVVSPAPQLMHGKASLIEHDDRGIFSGTPSPLIGGRYHSLAVEFPSLPECFLVTASCEGIIMGIRHRSAPLEGVQFHPESVLTQSGYRLLANWLAECGSPDAVARSAALDEKFGEMRKQLPGGGIV